jgi:hypothetical protein
LPPNWGEQESDRKSETADLQTSESQFQTCNEKNNQFISTKAPSSVLDIGAFESQIQAEIHKQICARKRKKNSSSTSAKPMH